MHNDVEARKGDQSQKPVEVAFESPKAACVWTVWLPL